MDHAREIQLTVSGYIVERRTGPEQTGGPRRERPASRAASSALSSQFYLAIDIFRMYDPACHLSSKTCSIRRDIELTEGERQGRNGAAGVPFRAITGAAVRTWWAVRPADRRQGSGIGQWDRPAGSAVRAAPIRVGRAARPTQHAPHHHLVSARLRRSGGHGNDVAGNSPQTANHRS